MGDKGPGAIFCLESRGRVSHSRDCTHSCAQSPRAHPGCWERVWRAGSDSSNATVKEGQGASLGKDGDVESSGFNSARGLGRLLSTNLPWRNLSGKEELCRERKQVQPKPRGTNNKRRRNNGIA